MSKENQATDGCRVERAGIEEVGEVGQVGCLDQKGHGCIGENSRDKVKDSRG